MAQNSLLSMISQYKRTDSFLILKAEKEEIQFLILIFGMKIINLFS